MNESVTEFTVPLTRPSIAQIRAQFARCKLQLAGYRPTPGTRAYHDVERLVEMRSERNDWPGIEAVTLMVEIDAWLRTPEGQL